MAASASTKGLGRAREKALTAPDDDNDDVRDAEVEQDSRHDGDEAAEGEEDDDGQEEHGGAAGSATPVEDKRAAMLAKLDALKARRVRFDWNKWFVRLL